jgi:2-polyprenyl-3-methyl-5-hydroxy-6-metoxy-1,4-benzoquinol methylase
VPDRPDLHEKLDVYLNEVHVALDLVSDALSGMGREGRVLEVGGGIGAVSACLAHLGHEVVAIEPGGPGFEDMLLLQAAIDGALDGMPALSGSRTVLPIGVEDLDPDVHGRFALVLSANVLEHVADVELALDRMQSVLAPDGVQRHVCPNYAFPYEPHFAIPLVPSTPSLTRVLLPRRITRTSLWESLNFITARQVRRWGRRAGVAVRFDRGVLAEALERFLGDEVFAERHAGLAGMVEALRRMRIVPLLRRLPVGVASPMRFTVRARDTGAA